MVDKVVSGRQSKYIKLCEIIDNRQQTNNNIESAGTSQTSNQTQSTLHHKQTEIQKVLFITAKQLDINQQKYRKCCTPQKAT